MVFKLNTVLYKTKISVTKAVQYILHNNEVDVWLLGGSKKTILDLLKYHPHYEIKRGCGIKGIKIQNTQYGKRGFVLYRVDNTYTDFSYIQCITHPTLLIKIKQACRTAISQDIINFKKIKFSRKKVIQCELTGKNITFNGCHVDHHTPTFKEIFDRWFINKKITLDDINHTKDNVETVYFTNKKIERDFKQFHNKLANLRIITPKENLKRKK